MVVKIKEKAYNKIYAYCTHAKNGEIGGLMLGKLEKSGDITVKDVILFEQIRNASAFEIDETSMMDFTKNASTKVLRSVVGWWHYHLQYGTFWSEVDDETFVRLTQLSNFCLGVVMSIPINGKLDDMTYRCRLDMYNRDGQYLSIDNIDCDVEKKTKFKFSWKEIKEEIKVKVNDDNRHWITCPKCNGYGTIASSNNKTKGQNKFQLTNNQQKFESNFDDFGYFINDEEQDVLDELVGGQNYGYGKIHKAKQPHRHN